MENTLEKALKQDSKVLALIKMKQNQKFISLMMACWLSWQSVWSWVNYPASLGLILSTYKIGKCHCFSIVMNSKGYNKCERGSFLNTLLFYILVTEAYILCFIFLAFLKKKKKRIRVLQSWDGFYVIQLLRPFGNFLWQIPWKRSLEGYSPQDRNESNTTL